MTAPEGHDRRAAPAFRANEDGCPNSTTARPATPAEIRRPGRRAGGPRQRAQDRRPRHDEALAAVGRWTSRSPRWPLKLRPGDTARLPAARPCRACGNQQMPNATPRSPGSAPGSSTSTGPATATSPPAWPTAGTSTRCACTSWTGCPSCGPSCTCGPNAPPRTLAGQAEWHTRLLPAAASQLAQRNPPLLPRHDPRVDGAAAMTTTLNDQAHGRSCASPAGGNDMNDLPRRPGGRHDHRPEGPTRVAPHGGCGRYWCMGHDCARIARALAVSPDQVRRVINGQTRTVTPAFRAAAVRALGRLVGQDATRRTPRPARAAALALAGTPGSVTGPPPRPWTKTNSTARLPALVPVPARRRDRPGRRFHPASPC